MSVLVEVGASDVMLGRAASMLASVVSLPVVDFAASSTVVALSPSADESVVDRVEASLVTLCVYVAVVTMSRDVDGSVLQSPSCAAVGSLT